MGLDKRTDTSPFWGRIFELNISHIEIAPLLLIRGVSPVGLGEELTEFQLIQWQRNTGSHEIKMEKVVHQADDRRERRCHQWFKQV